VFFGFEFLGPEGVSVLTTYFGAPFTDMWPKMFDIKHHHTINKSGKGAFAENLLPIFMHFFA